MVTAELTKEFTLTEETLHRVLEDHPENDESVLLNKFFINFKNNKILVEIQFVYEKDRCSVRYEKNVNTNQLNFLLNTLKKEK